MTHVNSKMEGHRVLRLQKTYLKTRKKTARLVGYLYFTRNTLEPCILQCHFVKVNEIFLAATIAVSDSGGLTLS